MTQMMYAVGDVCRGDTVRAISPRGTLSLPSITFSSLRAQCQYFSSTFFTQHSHRLHSHKPCLASYHLSRQRQSNYAGCCIRECGLIVFFLQCHNFLIFQTLQTGEFYLCNWDLKLYCSLSSSSVQRLPTNNQLYVHCGATSICDGILLTVSRTIGQHHTQSTMVRLHSFLALNKHQSSNSLASCQPNTNTNTSW